MQDLRSPAEKARWDRKFRAMERERKKHESRVAECRETFGGTWQPIKTMPFKSYDESYGINATVLLTDGTDGAVSTVQRRFGRPIKCTRQPEMAMTDHGITYIGGEYDEYDHPKWWFDWEFKDALEDDSDYGRPQIGFVPTHWMPLPIPPESDNEKEQGTNL